MSADLLAELIGSLDDTPLANPANRAPGSEVELNKGQACEALLTPANGCESARPYALTIEQGNRAHARPWGDRTIAVFQTRAGRLAGLGFGDQDASDLAEMLTLRDAERDDRAACIECRHLGGFRGAGFRCAWPAAAGLHGRGEAGEAWVTKLQRCPGFAEVAP
jgi:hypothetical protein